MNMNHIAKLNKLIATEVLDATVSFHATTFAYSNDNPLCTIRCMTMDPRIGESIDPLDCAALTGLPARLFETSEAPDVAQDDLERALGRMTLALLRSIRNELSEAAGLKGREPLVPVAEAALPASPVRVARRQAA